MKTITITWKAFVSDEVPSRKAMSKTIKYDTALTHVSICDKAFRETNLYEGYLWDALQPLPEGRTHTALSVGDEVTIDNCTYRCEPAGWDLVKITSDEWTVEDITI